MVSIPRYMTAAVLTGFGGMDCLEISSDVPVPVVGVGEVLIRVGACGINNTDINTRAGWYHREVRIGTTEEGGNHGFPVGLAPASDSGLEVKFPRIQGADVAGWIAQVGGGVSNNRVGERVLVDPRIRDLNDPDNLDLTTYLGNGIDGGFAQFCKVPSINAIAINTDLSIEELATFPCSSSTAELMLSRARVGESETVLVTGASGGVGSALIQLAKRRGAFVIAVTRPDKKNEVEKLNPDSIIFRDGSNLSVAIKEAAPRGEIDVVADIVGGQDFTSLINCLRRAGRYVTSGAISGPIVELDLRDLYLKDLDLLGATAIPRTIFTDLVCYIEDKEIKPVLAASFPLEELREAQKMFMKKTHVGNIVTVPPAI